MRAAPAIAILAALALLGAGGQGSAAGSSGARASRAVHLQRFRSPSGNIGCALYGGNARCDIRKREWKPPPHPASCEVDYGQGLSVGRRGRAEFVCAGDTTLDPTLPPLAYGATSSVGGTRCASRGAGITCTNAAGHGFFISIQSYRIF